MNEPPIIPSPKPAPRWPLFLLGVSAGVFLVFALILGTLAWRWLLRSDVAKVPPDGQDDRSQPVAETAEVAVTETKLFNGSDLEGWDFDPAIWSVRNGVIYGAQKQGGYGRSLFWQDAEVTDFELHFRFRLVRGNSGIYYRASRLANLDVGGYEFEIYTNKTGNLADNGTDREKRRLHRMDSTAPSLDSEWHEGVIIANGARLIHQMDGKVLCDLEDNDLTAPRTGFIALAMGSGTIVEFKDLRLNRTRQGR